MMNGATSLVSENQCASSVISRYRLPGQQHDEESGLYYNRHRYYDPLQGRYITQDPDGVERGMEFISVSFKSTTTN